MRKLEYNIYIYVFFRLDKFPKIDKHKNLHTNKAKKEHLNALIIE